MQKQLHLTTATELVRAVTPVHNSEKAAIVKKPARGTGLWTSTWREETYDSQWVSWCVSSEFGAPFEEAWWLLTPASDIKLYTVDSLRDLLALFGDYQWLPPRLAEQNRAYEGIYDDPLEHLIGIDFERLAYAYDGIHLTSRGNAATHLSYPHDLYGWDCESTLWFRWCFTDAERIETPVAPMRE